MADVETQLAPSPPHHNSYDGHHDDRKLEWLIQQQHHDRTDTPPPSVESNSFSSEKLDQQINENGKDNKQIAEDRNNKNNTKMETEDFDRDIQSTEVQEISHDEIRAAEDTPPDSTGNDIQHNKRNNQNELEVPDRKGRPKSGSARRSRTRGDTARSAFHDVSDSDSLTNSQEDDDSVASYQTAFTNDKDQKIDKPTHKESKADTVSVTTAYMSLAGDDNDDDEEEVFEECDNSKIDKQEKEDKLDDHMINPDQRKTVPDEELDDYTITADQRKAMQELEKMKQEMDYPVDEDPPEYNVTERLKVLNAELAEEPTPADGERERRIKFKDNLVDVVAPPPEYSEDEDFEDSHQDHLQKQEESGNHGNGLQTQSPPSGKSENYQPLDQSENAVAVGSSDKKKVDNQSENGQPGYDQSGSSQAGVVLTKEHQDDLEAEKVKLSDENNTEPQQVTSQSEPTKNTEEKVLIERDGKFELVSTSDLEAMEMGLGPALSPRAMDLKSTSHTPSPPSKPRPYTANGATTRRPPKQAQSQRAHSATPGGSPHSVSSSEGSDYSSPYGLNQEEKEKKRKQDEARDRRMRDQKELEKYEESQRRGENDEAFQAWLHKKKQEAARRREDDKQRQAHDDEDKERNSRGAFAEWLQLKREQKKMDKKVEKVRQQEMLNVYYVRPKEECEKAFKMWIRNKNEQAKKEQQQMKQQTRYHRLLARRSRKSQALAQAIQQSQTFRYVDYYGYRS